MTGSTTSMGTLIAAAARYRIGHVRAIDERSALRCPGALHIDQALGTADNPMTDSLTASAFSSTGTSRTVPGTIVTVLVRSRHVDLIPIRRHVSKAVLAMLVGNGLLAESGPRKAYKCTGYDRSPSIGVNCIDRAFDSASVRVLHGHLSGGKQRGSGKRDHS